MLLIDQVKKLPDTAGVYLFKRGKEILYIGKATSLRDRVRSYFSADLINTRGQFIVDMVFKADRVDHLKTDSVLEAIILEANLIKKHQPKYNTKEKDDRSYNYVVITKEDFPRVLLVRGRELDRSEGEIGKIKIKHKFGPYPNGSAIKEGLKIIRKIFPYRDKCAVSKDSPWNRGNRRSCFNRQIGLCPGVCVGEISKTDYAETIRNIKLFFEGKKKVIQKNLEQQMKEHAKNHEFEKAGKVKRILFALSHIQDVSLIKKSEEEIVGNLSVELPILRIEAYDIAHISGTNMVGAMVVMEDGELKKSDYRKFKIRSVNSSNDTVALKEILERRLKHKEWRLPDIIVYDGGIAQRNAVEEILKNNLGENHQAKIVGVVKNEKHKPERIIGEEDIIKKYKKEILLLNSEAHRFAISFHRKLRNLKR